MKSPVALTLCLGVLCLETLADFAVAIERERPAVYNRLSAPTSELDELVVKSYQRDYRIVNVPADDADYVDPVLAEGELPRVLTDAAGQPIRGSVVALYLVTPDGSVREPVVIQSTNPRLDAAAMKALDRLRFRPATWRGAAVTAVVGQEVKSAEAACPPAVPAATPPGPLVTQTLEPTGGKILRPQEWFYAEGHHGSVYMWTLSREDTSNDCPYTTGFRIQLFVGVKAATGKTARQFVLDFLAARKAEAASVIGACSEQEQGLFIRTCLETEEGPHRIRYSVFWGAGDLDAAAVTIAGTTRELWPTYVPTFDAMSAIELIDMSRFDGGTKH